VASDDAQLIFISQDLHSSQTAFALERAAKSLMRVEAVWEGLKSKGLPQPQRVDGSLVLQDKRRTGTVYTSSGKLVRGSCL